MFEEPEAPEKAGITNLAVKLLGTLFATIIAPILVAFVLKFTDDTDDKAKIAPKEPAAGANLVTPPVPPLPKQPAVEPQRAPSVATVTPSVNPPPSVVTPPPTTATPPNPAPSSKSSSKSSSAAPTAASQAVRLFNGKNLAGFYTFLGAPKDGDDAYGKNNDPEKVFTVRGGTIRVSGKVRGVLVTDKPFANYHLLVEYKWGKKIWPPDEKRARTSGIALHCIGPDGAARNGFPQCVKCQIKEGSTGDFVLYNGDFKGGVSLTVEAEKRQVGQGKRRNFNYVYQTGQPLTTLTNGFFLRQGRPATWKDVAGVPDEQGLEKGGDEWNTLECICDRDRITIILNGKTVNVGTKCSQTRGKIAIMSGGSEVFFRTINLTPLSGKL